MHNRIKQEDCKDLVKDIIVWIRKFFAVFPLETVAVIGISGGKDSLVCAKLLVEALGKDRVVGVSIPNGEQSDIEDVNRIFDLLRIKRVDINIKSPYEDIISELKSQNIEPTDQCTSNLPARLRMCALYSIAQSLGGLVCNTCNYSETYIGWETKYGDAAGDFSPLGNITKTLVCEIGKTLGLPEDLVNKTPSDGLCGSSDEEAFGFSYDVLDKYLNDEKDVVSKDIVEKIEKLHKYSEHKRTRMSTYYNYSEDKEQA